MNFLSERRFQVALNGKKSSEKELKVGCVQGSILGPRLFTLYISHLQNMIKSDVSVISYADDTYVSVSAKTLPEVKLKLKEQITMHNKLLKEIGMVTNVSKTELIYFGRKPIQDAEPIDVNGEIITPTTAMKVLGVYFENTLTWNVQLQKVIKKAKVAIMKMKYLSRYIDAEGMKKILTSHFYGLIYYATPMWLGQMTNERTWKMLESVHYKALRTSINDHRGLWSKEDLDSALNRAKPKAWMQYCSAKMAIQLMNLQGRGPPISTKLINQQYVNDRMPNRTKIYDASMKKVGKHSFRNRLGFFHKVNFDWRQGLSKDLLRINLKKTFFE